LSWLYWIRLAFNSLWVLGAAVILAAFGFCYYDAHVGGERLRARLITPAFRMWLLIGLTLIGLGAALTASRWWERALWGLLCAANVWQIWVFWQESRSGED